VSLGGVTGRGRNPKLVLETVGKEKDFGEEIGERGTMGEGKDAWKEERGEEKGGVTKRGKKRGGGERPGQLGKKKGQEEKKARPRVRFKGEKNTKSKEKRKKFTPLFRGEVNWVKKYKRKSSYRDTGGEKDY